MEQDRGKGGTASLVGEGVIQSKVRLDTSLQAVACLVNHNFMLYLYAIIHRFI